MTKDERKVESILLYERRKLIQSVINSQQIKLRGSTLYVNKRKHGLVVNFNYVPTTNEVSQDSVPSHTNESTQWLCNNNIPGLWNARSLMNKLNEFQSVVYNKNQDIICITKTWLNNTIFSNEILPTSYTVYRNDRVSRGGGVLIAIKNSIMSQHFHLGEYPTEITNCMFLQST